MTKRFHPFLMAALLSSSALAVPAAAAQLPPKALLSVPFVSEVPDGKWVGSWKNACEEASVAMVDRYYAGSSTAPKAWAKSYMSGLFAAERKRWGSDANTDTAATSELIASNSSFSSKVVSGVTVDAIRSELSAGRPVIVPINGFTLANRNIPFLASGSGYHMFVIIGYDDAAKSFVVNDNGDAKNGSAIRYSYDRVMSSLHDYNSADKKTDGPQAAIFTFPKLAKTAASHRVYYLSGDTRSYVSHPAVFAEKGWSWSWVNTVSESFLAGFKDGAAIRP